MNAEAEIAELQMLLAHQGRVIEDLSDEIRRQGLAIDRLQAAVRGMEERVETMEPRPEVTRPPHY
ncbi:SlyX family protein [Aureimonas sp. Leaf454]|uniref:SlyX family protein n=1 Tax=Aureimonas sp. Leaf454 TaxID=1736381 RepID=UPI0012E377CD|nr:SlyX family protein [Aureimonas sp. Leaf454]